MRQKTLYSFLCTCQTLLHEYLNTYNCPVLHRRSTDVQAIDSHPLPQSAGYFVGQLTGGGGNGHPGMPPLRLPVNGMAAAAQPSGSAVAHQQQQGSHDRRMHPADGGAGASGDSSDSDSCRSGDSDGEDASARGLAANGRQHSGATGGQDSSPVRPGHWSTSQPLAIKQESGGQDRSSGRQGLNNRTKKPHLKVRLGLVGMQVAFDHKNCCCQMRCCVRIG